MARRENRRECRDVRTDSHCHMLAFKTLGDLGWRQRLSVGCERCWEASPAVRCRALDTRRVPAYSGAGLIDLNAEANQSHEP